ncbi:MAG: ferritin-like domain-containing protein [Armatimonadota bacterium]|nr:ferritin-like domain-containing protein [bacterium]
MASVVDDLNNLLARERGEVEALRTVVQDLHSTDPDLADSGDDVVQAGSWCCNGLYKRISQLDGTPTLDSTDLERQVSDKPDVPSKLKMVCSREKDDRSQVKHLLKRDDLDNDTREFLREMLDMHMEKARWCESTLDQWKHEE